MIVAPILNLDGDDSRKTVLAWMSLLLEQIKKIREERIAAGKGPDAPGAD